MRLARFRRIARAYGGDLARWPAELREAARRRLRRDPDAAHLLAEERRLDCLIERWDRGGADTPGPRLAFEARLIPVRYRRTRATLATFSPVDVSALQRAGFAALMLFAVVAGYSAGTAGFASGAPPAGQLDLSDVIEGIPGLKGTPAS